jgi:putative PIN family toxin of toxin-antitoxin system
MASDSRERFVFDTNTLVSGYLFPHSIPGQAVDCVFANYTLLMSFEVAKELVCVFRRKKFDRFLTSHRRNELVAETILEAEFVTTATSVCVCRDPDDNKLLELAIDGKASAIVTGDTDLLILGPFQGISVVTPRDFLSRFGT